MSGSRHLDAAAIIRTAEQLSQRVGDRFPDRGIHRLSLDLAELSVATRPRIEALARPRWVVRIAVGLVALVLAGGLVVWASQLRGFTVDDAEDWLQTLENGIQDLVFVGVGGLLLLQVEVRLKRRPALRELHELRSLVHVIDMHQLTKDPEAVLSPGLAQAHSPVRIDDRFQLARYLEYCSEMLAITGKLAALYAQYSQDALVLGAVREIEELVGMLSGKIWQKIVILDTVAGRGARNGTGPAGATAPHALAPHEAEAVPAADPSS